MLYTSLFLALFLRYQQLPNQELLHSHLWPFTVLFVLWFIVFFINGLYDLPLAKNEVAFFKRTFQAIGINFLVSMSFFYVIPFFQIAPKTNLIMVMVVFMVLELVWRSLFNSIILPHAFLNNVLYIGDINTVPELKMALSKKNGLGYAITAVIDPQLHAKEKLQSEGIACYVDVKKTRSVVSLHNINTVVVGPEHGNNQDMQKELYELVFWGTTIVSWERMYEELLGRVPIHILSEKWFWDNLQESKKQWYDMARTVSDVALASMVLVVFMVLLPMTALALWIETGRPIFYKQRRVGQRGKPYDLYKVRSMYKLNRDGSAETQSPVFTKEKDERVTVMGRFIRATRIDEMPQAFNVIKREMNFIGLRPERPGFVDELQQDMPYYAVRHLVRPGITGWAQVNNPLHSSLKENLIKLEYDLYYIKNRSFLLDLVILLRTFNIILRGIGR